MSSLRSQNGFALLITLAIMAMLAVVAVMAIDTATDESDMSFNQLHSDEAFYTALAGIEYAKAELEDSADWRAGQYQVQFDQGVFTTIVLDSTVRPALKDTVLVRSVGQNKGGRSIVEVLMIQEKYHPLFNHAIYAGNYTEYDSAADTQNYISTMEFGGAGSTKDSIDGDIWFNGHIDVSGDAVINGTAYAGGEFTGNEPTDTALVHESYLEPPDLKAQNYQSTADFYVGNSSPWDAYGHITASDPRHIFVKNFRSDLSTTMGYNFDNTNFFLGDPYQGINIDKISVSASGNKKVYFVDGNLWIEPNGETSRLINSPPDGTQITIVVKGNIYFSDNLAYDNPAKDGLAFIAMTDGESYTDNNGNGQYDPGEPILHDDGDGIYEGPSEGSGNIRFGDPNGGPLGDINAFLYAENNFEDYVLDGPDGTPQQFSVNGMLSAGNQLRINRDFPGGHSPMDVTYDSRLQQGLLDLPGLPKRHLTASGGWAQVGWREL